MSEPLPAILNTDARMQHLPKLDQLVPTSPSLHPLTSQWGRCLFSLSRRVTAGCRRRRCVSTSQKCVCEHRCVHTERRRWRSVCWHARNSQGKAWQAGRQEKHGGEVRSHMRVTSAGVCVLHSQQIERTSEDVRMRRSCRGAEEEEECILPRGETAHAAHTPSGTLCRFPDN